MADDLDLLCSLGENWDEDEEETRCSQNEVAMTLESTEEGQETAKSADAIAAHVAAMQKELAALRKEMKEQKEESAQIALQEELAAMRKELKEQKEKTTKLLFQSATRGNTKVASESCSRKMIDRARQSKKETAASKPDGPPVVTERFSGIRLINPRVSVETMAQRMEGRRMVRLSKLATGSTGLSKEDNWVTMGVIIQKSPPKESPKSGKFCSWKLTDLSSLSAVVTLFLFKDVYKEHWKTSEGAVVALLNPDFMPPKDQGAVRDEVAITMGHPNKLMYLGQSKDFGICKGKNRTTQKDCRNFINKLQGEYCEYHVKAAYNRARSGRMECQSGYRPQSKKLKRNDGNVYVYNGEMFASRSGAGERKSDNKSSRLTTAHVDGAAHLMKAEGCGSHSGGPVQSTGTILTTKASETFQKLLQQPQSAGARHFLQFQKASSEGNKPKTAFSASQILNSQGDGGGGKREVKENSTWLQKQSRTVSRKSDLAKEKAEHESAMPFYSNDDDERPAQGGRLEPQLGRGLTKGCVAFDLGKTVPQVAMKQRKAEAEKQQAVEIMRKRRAAAASDSTKRKISPDEAKRRAAANCQKKTKQSTSVENRHNTDSKSARRLKYSDFDIDASSEEGRRLLAAKSKHGGLSKMAHEEMLERYFGRLGEREKMEDKMTSIMSLRVSVVTCRTCKYTAESAARRCIDEKHDTVKHKACKRFFQCNNCSQRAHTYDEVYPGKSCRHCGSQHFTKTAMYRERKVEVNEKLLIRGEEQPKFLNSLE